MKSAHTLHFLLLLLSSGEEAHQLTAKLKQKNPSQTDVMER